MYLCSLINLNNSMLTLNMKWFKVTVFCFIVCVVKCSGMLKSELEDFADHLEKTSKLDVILKKGNPAHDYDEDEMISDFAWEDSGKFEGDLILNDRQRKLLVEDVAEGLARNGLRDSTKRWPDNEVVYYIQKEHFNSDQVQAIMSGIEDLAQASCIKFRPYKKGDRSAVVIQGSRRGCFSQVGYQGGYQVLNLSHRHPVGRGCFRHGTVVHELLHSLGFYHMQSSPDRDDYINVLWENIAQPARHNFRKYNSFSVTDFGVGYDYDSVLHYSRRAFSVNGRDTLVPKQSGTSIGQRSGLSDKDAKKLNKMYCDGDSEDTHAADENDKEQSTKKKKPKSTPFQGHGIGYHQGKTVVIKLNPEAKTYKITSTIPRYPIFDHFSTTPQALSPTKFFEGPGTAKEINYGYIIPKYTIELLSYDNNNSTGVEQKMYFNNNPAKSLNVAIPNKDVKTHDKKNQKEHSEESTEEEDKQKGHYDESTEKEDKQKGHSDESTEEDDNATKVGDTVNEAIDRLGKILKTHVYPSQTPDLNIYKIKPYYSELFAPTTTLKSNPRVLEGNEDFRTKLSFFKTVDPEQNIGIKASSPDEELSVKIKKENKTEAQDDNNLNYPHYKDISNFPDYSKDTYHNEHTSTFPNSKEEQEQLPKEEYTIYKYRYPMFMNFLNYKPQSYYNDQEYSKGIAPPYKSISQFYNKDNDSDEKDLENVYTGLREGKNKTTDKQKDKSFSRFYNKYNDGDEKDLENVYTDLKENEDEIKDEGKEEIEAIEEPTSTEVESSYRTYPLHTLNKVKEEIIEKPHYYTIDILEHLKNKDALSTKGKDELLTHAVPLQNKLYKIEDNEHANNKHNIASSMQSAPNEEKENFLQKLQLVAHIKSMLSKLPTDKDAYHLFGVLVPVTQEGASSIQNNKPSKANM